MLQKIKKITSLLFGIKGSRFIGKIYKRIFPLKQDLSEIAYIKLVLENVNEGDFVIDIGANVGLWSISLQKKVTTTGTVCAFEPVPSTFLELQKATKNISNIVIKNIGISDRKGTEVILCDPIAIAPPGASLSRTVKHIKNIDQLEPVNVKLDTLDNIFYAKNESIKFIKIDVEGHEFNVIKGGVKTIAKYKPILFIEILREYWIDNKPNNLEVAQLLLEMGYKMSQVHQDKIVNDPMTFDINHENFLFFSE